MLVCGRVEDDIRLLRRKDIIDGDAVANRSDIGIHDDILIQAMMDAGTVKLLFQHI